MKIRIGIICPSEIALRRFLPALQKLANFEYVGVAIANPEEWFGNRFFEISKEYIDEVLLGERQKAELFIESYGGMLFESYQSMIESDMIDAIYLPLPPALHYKWAKSALLSNKHILIEKPSTICYNDTLELVDIAKSKHLAIHENYMFVFHSQIEAIQNIIRSNEIGEVRLYRISFGFPLRGANDFRYNKKLGGGALWDCGGYTIKLANLLLGESARLSTAQLNYIDSFEVDCYGAATMLNDRGQTAQLAFGMDNSYKCDLEVWGSLGTLYTNRILTAPTDFIPKIVINKQGINLELELSSDDTFSKSIKYFENCIIDKSIQYESFNNIVRQSNFIDVFFDILNEDK